MNPSKLKKALAENKDNLASAYADLEIAENIQKLDDAVCEKGSTDWVSIE